MSDINTKMTIKEARKLLGEKYSDMSDDSVRKLVDDLSMLARLSIQDSRARLSRERQETIDKDLKRRSSNG